MTVTLLASADEPQPRPVADPPPVTGSPWHPRYAQHRRGINPIPCCDLARGGDRCTCRADLAETRRAFRHPIVLDLTALGGAA